MIIMQTIIVQLALILQNIIFWDVEMFNMTVNYKRFGEISCLNPQKTLIILKYILLIVFLRHPELIFE
jgi:hypothetical protein